MGSFLQDLRLAARLLRRAPLTSSIVILTLGLGIGANAAIFSVVRATFLGRLPYGNAERLVYVSNDNLERGWLQFGVSLQDFLDWKAQSRTLENLSAYWTGRGNLTGAESAARVRFATVSTNLFQTLGTSPRLGRGFTLEDGEPGQTGVVVLSDGFWRRVLGGRDDVIGQSVELDGQRLTVLGVMPPGFAFPTTGPDFWIPLPNGDDGGSSRGARYLSVIAAVAPGRSLEDAQVELAGIGARLSTEYPATNTGWTVSLEPFRTTLISDQRQPILVAWAAVSLVLLIAAANVANLLLIRALRRRNELAVRAALGAARGRLARQLLTESLVLTLAGGVLGVALAWAGLRWISGLAPAGLPGLERLGLDSLVLLYTAGLMLVTGVGFGTFPALRTLGVNLGSSLRSGDRSDVSAGSRRWRDILVVAELGLAAMVLVGAGLTIRSLGRLLQVEPGFQSAGRFTLSVAPSRNEMPERSAATLYFERVLAATAAVPGVQRVGAISVLPVPGGTWWNTSFFVDGLETPPGADPVAAERVVMGDYFGTMGIPVLAGRSFLPSDRADAEPVAVIDQSLAQQYWAGQDPVGQRLSFEKTGRNGQPRRWYRVVGVVGPVRSEALEVAPTPVIYTVLPQAVSGHFRDWQMAVVAEGPTEAQAAVRHAVEAAGPGVPVYGEQTIDQLVAGNVARRRFAMTLLSGFGTLALVLAAVGVYGLLAAVVAERTRELGLRLALGAAPGRLLHQILRDGLSRAGIGLGLGLGAAALGSRLVGSLLYGVTPTDPLTYLSIGALLLLVTLAAAAIPAWRAARVDPMTALRSE